MKMELEILKKNFKIIIGKFLRENTNYFLDKKNPSLRMMMMNVIMEEELVKILSQKNLKLYSKMHAVSKIQEPLFNHKFWALSKLQISTLFGNMKLL